MENTIELSYEIPWSIGFMTTAFGVLFTSGFRRYFENQSSFIARYYIHILTIVFLSISLGYSKVQLEYLKNQIDNNRIITVSGNVEFVKHFSGTEAFSVSGVVFYISPSDVYCYGELDEIVESTYIAVAYVEVDKSFSQVIKKCILSITKKKSKL